jgi:hypothetical protein
VNNALINTTKSSHEYFINIAMIIVHVIHWIKSEMKQTIEIKESSKSRTDKDEAKLFQTGKVKEFI